MGRWVNAVASTKFFLQSDDPDKDIHIYVNSPGGIVSSGLAIYDTMQYVKPDIATYCIGQAASGGALLLRQAPKARGFCASQLKDHASSAHGSDFTDRQQTWKYMQGKS